MSRRFQFYMVDLIWLTSAMAFVFTLDGSASHASERGEGVPQSWNPAKTWVFAVSLARFQGNRLHPFDPAERIDGDFEELFERRGVPRSQIVFLKDEHGTTNRIRAAFKQLLLKTRGSDFLFFYFGSHASYDPRKNEYSFSTYDGRLPFDWSVDAIETLFRGSHAFLTTDCCNSGGIIDVVQSRSRSEIAYACLTSMYSHSSGSNVWRFMRCLMRGIAGDPRQDLDKDGYLELHEVALSTREELSFLRETSPMFFNTDRFDPRLRMSKASGPRHEATGRAVLVRSQDGRLKAITETINGRQTQIRYGDNDRLEWVATDRLEPFKPPPPQLKGARVWIQSTCCGGGLWHPATVLDSWATLHFCRPDNYSEAYDEWVGPSRFLAPMTGNWLGQSANSAGDVGDFRLQLKEAGDGTLTGTWNGVPLEGQRIGAAVVCLTAKLGQRSYRMAGRIRGDFLVASFAVAKTDGARSFGWVRAGRDAAATAASAPQNATFSGRWTGSYKNTKGQGGKETLEVNEASDGDLAAIWTDGVRLRGQRVGPDVIYLEGQWGTRSYFIVGLAAEGGLYVHYSAHEANGERYYGLSTLRRQ